MTLTVVSRRVGNIFLQFIVGNTNYVRIFPTCDQSTCIRQVRVAEVAYDGSTRLNVWAVYDIDN